MSNGGFRLGADQSTWLTSSFSRALHLSQCHRQQIQSSRDETALSVSSPVQESTSVALVATDNDGQSTKVDIDSGTESDPAEQSTAISLAGAFSRVNAPACSVRHCCCSCHLTGNISARFWGLEYTPLSVLLRKCDNERCTSRHLRYNLRLALSKYGIPWAVAAGLDFLFEAGGYSIRPALRMERIVTYTSPGFETLWRCQNSLISSSQARTTFVKLYRSDPSLERHVNPAGKSYIQVTLLDIF